MRRDLKESFVDEVQTALRPILEELGFTYVGETDEPLFDKSCLFQSSTFQLIVAVASDYLSSIGLLLKKTERRFLLGHRVRRLNLVNLAEAIGCEPFQGDTIKSSDDLKMEIDRLKEWVRRYGKKLASVDVELWRRGEEAGKIRLRRWEVFSRDPEKAKLYHQKRREAGAAKERGDLAGFVEAYESIGKWLGLAEREELEKVRRKIAES